VQALLYADAVERAGLVQPLRVVEALKDFEFDGMGNGPTLYRGEDHQCFKDVLVVKGKENPKTSSTFSRSSKSRRSSRSPTRPITRRCAENGECWANRPATRAPNIF
jgi:hypothetical protein